MHICVLYIVSSNTVFEMNGHTHQFRIPIDLSTYLPIDLPYTSVYSLILPYIPLYSRILPNDLMISLCERRDKAQHYYSISHPHHTDITYTNHYYSYYFSPLLHRFPILPLHPHPISVLRLPSFPSHERLRIR